MARNTLFDEALRLHQAGRLADAQGAYEQVLKLNPRHADALHYLGLARYQGGDRHAGRTLVEQALAIQPRNPDVHYNLGNILREGGDATAAAKHYRTAVELNPAHIQAQLNLAGVLSGLGEFDEATLILRQIVGRDPTNVDAHVNLGVLLEKQERFDAAEAALRKATELSTRSQSAAFNFGAFLQRCGRDREAIPRLRHAVHLRSDDADALNSLGVSLRRQRQFDEAIECFRQALRLQPNSAELFSNLGVALHAKGQLNDAIAAHKQALALDAAYTAAYKNLGPVYKEQGRLDDAIKCYRDALAIEPDHVVHSNLLFALCFKHDANPMEVFVEHRNFDARYAAPLRGTMPPPPNSREPSRRLKIGYVSPDFRRHPGGHFLLPALEHHDQDRYETYCYSVGGADDDFTERFRAAATHWVDAVAWPDAALANKIRDDGIDILVECAGHMARNRLLVFARKAAPVQVSFPLYPNTTGIAAIDYRIMDRFFAPPSADAVHTERILRMPDAHVCYEPGNRTIAPRSMPPSGETGSVMFGCFNNAAKLNEPTVELWSKLLLLVPEAKLTLKWLGLDETGPDLAAARFSRYGVGRDRLVFAGWSQEPYSPFQAVDISLDPLHCNGGTTTCDSLWMGVPVVTRYSETPFSRVGLCHLTNVGLTELIAADDDSYLEIARNLACSRDRLVSVRMGLRERFSASPLMDAPRYVRHLEAAYRDMWERWCSSGSSS